MSTNEEMQRSVRFNRDRAIYCQAIADKGGDDTWTKAAAQFEANRFQGWADHIAGRIEERSS